MIWRRVGNVVVLLLFGEHDAVYRRAERLRMEIDDTQNVLRIVDEDPGTGDQIPYQRRRAEEASFVLAAGAGWRWAVYSVLSGLAFLVTFFVFGLGFSQEEPFVDVAGLWQRVCIVIGWTWLTALAVRSLQPH